MGNDKKRIDIDLDDHLMAMFDEWIFPSLSFW